MPKYADLTQIQIFLIPVLINTFDYINIIPSDMQTF